MILPLGLWPLRLVLPRMIHSGACAATRPWMFQSGGWRVLLLDPRRMFQSGAFAADCPRMIQFGGWRLLLLDPPRMSLCRAPAWGFCCSFPLWFLPILVLPRMFQSGASAATCAWMIPSWERRLLLFVPPRTIQSGAFGLLRGLVRVFACLRLHRLLLFAASLLHHGFVSVAAAPHLPGLVDLCVSPLPRPLHCSPAPPRPWHLLHFSASPQPCLPGCISASPRPLSLDHSSASVHLHGIVLCVVSGPVCAVTTRLRPPISFASGRHFPPDAPVRGVGAPPVCSAPDDPVGGARLPLIPGRSSPGVAAPPAWSQPDDQVRGTIRHLSLGVPVRGGASCCLFRPECSGPGRPPPLVPG